MEPATQDIHALHKFVDDMQCKVLILIQARSLAVREAPVTLRESEELLSQAAQMKAPSKEDI